MCQGGGLGGTGQAGRRFPPGDLVGREPMLAAPTAYNRPAPDRWRPLTQTEDSDRRRLPSELIAQTPFSPRFPRPERRRSSALQHRVQGVGHRHTRAYASTWLLAIELTLLSGDRCGETRHSPQLGRRNCALLALGQLLQRPGRIVHQLVRRRCRCLGRDGLLKEPAGLVISGASSNGSSASGQNRRRGIVTIHRLRVLFYLTCLIGARSPACLPKRLKSRSVVSVRFSARDHRRGTVNLYVS